MSAFCHFDISSKNADSKHERMSVLFTPGRLSRAKDAVDELKELLSGAYTPSRTILIGLQDDIVNLRKLAKSEVLSAANLPIDLDKLQILYFGQRGLLYRDSDNQRVSSQLEERIRRQGMTRIFVKRGGLMSSGVSYHYVKPSGSHSTKFLRPGNILRSNAEVAFIAAWILRYLTEFTPTIYSDTASITQIAYASVAMGKRIGVCKIDPQIHSFGSYSGLRNMDSINAELDDVVLVSATTSGNLTAEIAGRTGASSSNIITLFSTVENGSLCNLSHSEELNPNGIDIIQSYSVSRCVECAAGSLPITIAGDSFLPETPEPKVRLLRRSDAPSWHARVLSMIEKKKVARCFRPALSTGDRDYTLFCDLSRLCGGDSFKNNFQGRLSRLLVLGVDVIIHLPDEASRKIGEKARSMYPAKQRPKLLVADNTLSTELAKCKNELDRNISVIVIASCVAGGFTLLATSRALRNVADKISYFVALAMPPSKEAWDQMQSNLSHRNDEQGGNLVEVVWLAPLPRSIVGLPCPWKLEYDWLRECENLSNYPILESRLNLFNNKDASRNNGLIENVFLSSFGGDALTLAPNFAFHKCAQDALSQADVFMIVSSILHHLRSPKVKDGLRQTMNSHVLLDPENFARYNDAVLQAALLRAAHASELAFATHALASQSMADLICRMIAMHKDEEGRALPEFLLALVTKRMSLVSSHLKLVIDCLNDDVNGCEYFKLFCGELNEIAVSI